MKIRAPGPITSWQIEGETMETETICLGSKITADGNCSHEVRRRLLLGRKAMKILENILKSKNIALPKMIHKVKAMVFPVSIYGCKTWTKKKKKACQELMLSNCGAGEDS